MPLGEEGGQRELGGPEEMGGRGGAERQNLRRRKEGHLETTK